MAKQVSKPNIFWAPSLETARKIDDEDTVKSIETARYRFAASMADLERCYDEEAGRLRAAFVADVATLYQSEAAYITSPCRVPGRGFSRNLEEQMSKIIDLVSLASIVPPPNHEVSGGFNAIVNGKEVRVRAVLERTVVIEHQEGGERSVVRKDNCMVKPSAVAFVPAGLIAIPWGTPGRICKPMRRPKSVETDSHLIVHSRKALASPRRIPSS